MIALCVARTSESQKGIKQISLEELSDMLTYTYRDKVVLLSLRSPYCGDWFQWLLR